MSFCGISHLICLCVVWGQVSMHSLPPTTQTHSLVAINTAAMNRFRSEINTMLRELVFKAGNAHTVYAKSHGITDDSHISIVSFFVDSPPPAYKWTCLRPSKRFNKCVSTLKAFMAPLKVVVDNERQRANGTDETHTADVINKLRLIWLQSAYLGLKEMMNQSGIIVDNTPITVNMRELDRVVKEQQKASSGTMSRQPNVSPTVQRNYAILEALSVIMIDLFQVCQVYPAHVCPGAIRGVLSW